MDRSTLAAVLFVFFHISSSCAKSLNDLAWPEKCRNMNFCTAINDNKTMGLIETALNSTVGLFDEYPEAVTQRVGDDKDSPEDECRSSSHMDPIHRIKDDANRIRFVVQSEKKFKQIIRIEQCDKPGPLTKPTRNISLEQMNKTQFTCHQCMLNYKFLVLSLDGKSLETVNVKGGLPVCCSCRKQGDNYLDYLILFG